MRKTAVNLLSYSYRRGNFPRNGIRREQRLH
jgi:hypothetical protein